jgi:hypothetical protein
MQPKTIWEFTVIAAIVSTLGALLGLFLKDFLFVRYFDRERDKKSLEKISRKYKDPILLAATELLKRVAELSNNYSQLYPRYSKQNLFAKVHYLAANDSSDPYFLNYRAVSTLYRFCAFFGWLEMYRQDISFLDSHSHKKRFQSLKIIEQVREAVAEGRLNNEEDWDQWTDVLIFREELRAIGEGMIEAASNGKSIAGYSKFRILIEEFEKEKKPVWLRPAINFFTEFKPLKDFRIRRLEFLKEHLSSLVKCLDKEYYHDVKKWIR